MSLINSFKDILKDTKFFPNFGKNICIKLSEVGGRGVFATADIMKGDIIIIENSIATNLNPPVGVKVVEEIQFTA